MTHTVIHVNGRTVAITGDRADVIASMIADSIIDSSEAFRKVETRLYIAEAERNYFREATRSSGSIIVKTACELADLKRICVELLQALKLSRPFVHAWPQCRDKELLVVDAAITKAEGSVI